MQRLSTRSCSSWAAPAVRGQAWSRARSASRCAIAVSCGRSAATSSAPRGGVSRYSIAGGPLEDRAGDAAFFAALRQTMPPTVRLVERQEAAEDPAFVEAAVATLIELIEDAGGGANAAAVAASPAG